MTLIVGLSAIVFFIIGYYVMNKIDIFLESNIYQWPKYLSYEQIDNKKDKQNIILIYGKNELTDLVEAYCDSKKYLYDSITEINYINTKHKYICLLALSHNDADNLTISSIGFKVYSISSIASLCNTKSNLKIYQEFNVSNVLLYDDIHKVFNNIKELIENAVQNKG